MFHLVLILLFAEITATREPSGSQALDEFPLIDGHNDLPYNIYLKLQNQIEHFNFEKNLSSDSLFGKNCKTCHTDLVKIKQGKLGAQFWSAYVDCNSDDIVGKSLAQIDLIKRFVAKYPHDLEFVTTADEIVDAFLRKRLASLIGLEGGHSIDNKMALLRQFYALGVRYMTLTHVCDLPWADSSLVDANNSPKKNLTEFGKRIILEMNRLGMMVDLSHVSHGAQVEALEISKAPVIFSHSSAFSVFEHHRNVRDDVLVKLKDNQGIIMVNFYSKFIGKGLVTIEDVAKHVNHIVDVAGVDFVGIGSDFDGVDSLPQGLEDVSKFPNLFDHLQTSNSQRWTDENLQKLAGRNFHRVFKQVETVKEALRNVVPDESVISSRAYHKSMHLGLLLVLIFAIII